MTEYPEWAYERPRVGIAPRLSDAELVTLAVIQVMVKTNSGSNTRWTYPSRCHSTYAKSILALTTVIRHNQTTNQPGPARSLIAYDH